MILAVSAGKWERLRKLCAGEDVEATVIGRFEATGRLRLCYEGQEVGDLSMHFLHDGRPPVVRQATLSRERSASADPALAERSRPNENFTDTLLKVLAAPNVCSKEWIIRQYDHEVQGGS